MNLTNEDVQNILRIIDSPCVELHLETSEFKLFVRKAGDLRSSASPIPEASGAAASVGRGAGNAWKAAPPAAAADSVMEPGIGTPATRRALGAQENAIIAPMVGTFYRAPSPGAPSFVEVGDLVEADTVVCIIEVMKLMNSIVAERQGRVVEILVENAQLVENGQPLIIIGPTA